MTRLTLLHWNSRGEKRECFCLLSNGGGRVYRVVVEKIWIKGYLMRIDKWSKRIINLDPILVFRESLCIIFGGWWEYWESKMTKTSVFPVAYVTVLRVKSFSIPIKITSFLFSNWSSRCLVSRNINLTHKFKIF